MENKDKVLIKRKQIVFDVHPELHKQIKIASVKNEMTMNNWLSIAIHEKLQKESNVDKK